MKTHLMYDDLLNYLKNPVICKNEKPKFSLFLFLFISYFIIAIGIGFFAAIIVLLAHIKRTPLPFHSTAVEILYVVMIGPVLEEILFRSWLKFKTVNIVLLFITLTFFLLNNTTGHPRPYFIFGSAALLFILGTSLSLFKRENMASFIQKHFKFFFYASSLVFGLGHATNFTGHPWLILALSPILAGPQIVLGFLLGYIRMKHGLVYSMLFHMLVNTIIIFQFF